ncbi:uncharacterized protein LOC106142967 [Amyelois transitella]|uniref:uncharacterized protein LOC106142967 n=1 Tax=Amyelois transitella TaxID=680683 RepID=UPI00067AF3F7|nr:uncharacterized protein LOC106142967 [Amyelois transitella]
MADKARMESMLFSYETTNRTDYRPYELRASEVTRYVEKPKKKRPPYVKSVKGIQTMTPWQCDVPFYLLHKPKEIIRTNPYEIQRRFEKPKDTDREVVQKSRPRLVMTPSVSMDDIEDPEARQILCDDMYTSTATAGMREAVKPYYKVEAPFPGLPAKANPVVLPKYSPPVVPPEWRMDSVSWDSRQLRCFCDPTKEFWLSYPLFKCRACEESAIVEAHRKAKRLAKH